MKLYSQIYSAIVYTMLNSGVDKLLFKVSGEEKFDIELPRVNTEIQDNPLEIMKNELEQDSRTELRFARVLPDTWNRLLIKNSYRNNTATYIFSVIGAISSRIPDYVWLNHNELENYSLPEEDMAVIDLFKDIYNLD